MLQQREPIYSPILQEIQLYTHNFSNFSDIPAFILQKIGDFLKTLNLSQLEIEHNTAFSHALIDKFHHHPQELIKQFMLLEFFKHPLQPQLPNFKPLIHHICDKPNPLPLLRLLFAHISPEHYKIAFHPPPYINEGLSKETFVFLLEKHEQYHSTISPVFWALQKDDIQILERVLTAKPDWINKQNQSGLTPLMYVISEKKIESLRSLLKFNPNIRLKNYKQETIAHLICQNGDMEWIYTLIHGQEFQCLELSRMLKNAELKDNEQQIPLSYAIYHSSMLPWVKDLLEQTPALQLPFFQSYFKAIRLNRTDILEILHQELQVNLTIEYWAELCLLALEMHHEHQFDWLVAHHQISRDTLQVARTIKHIEKMEWDLVNQTFNDNTIDWQGIPPIFCFWITSKLIKTSQSDRLAELNLFERTSNFHTYTCLKTGIKTNFIDVSLSQPDYHLSPKLIQNFLAYLESNQSSYPRWLAHFHDDVPKLLQYWSVPKNTTVYGSPLIHFIALEDERNHSQKLNDFINAEVLINRHDQQHQHLFYKLLHQSKHGFERIKQLKKSFPKFTLENLDSQGSNLLHLAINLKHIACIQWCLAQNLKPLSYRTIDSISALEIAFEFESPEIYNLLKKHIKKNDLLPFFEDLVRKNHTSLLEHLLQEAQNLNWKFSAAELQQLKALHHSVIDDYLEAIAPKPINQIQTTASVMKPKSNTIKIDHDALLGLIANNNTHVFEKLIQPEYNSVLSELFLHQFMYYLQQVFESPITTLNKIFIRIPAAQQKIKELNPWHQLFSLGLEEGKEILVQNLLGREVIRAELRTQTLKYYQQGLSSHPRLWFKVLSDHFPLTMDEEQILLLLAIEHENPQMMRILLEMQNFQNQLVNASDETSLKLAARIQLPHWADLLTTDNHIQKHMVAKADLFFIELFRHQNYLLLETMLTNPNFRHNLIAKKETVLTQVIQDNNIDLLHCIWKNHADLVEILRPYYPALTIIIPPLVKMAFDLELPSQQILFLVGSTIHFILENIPFSYLNDIDLIAPQAPTSYKFKQSRVLPQLFFTNLEIDFQAYIKVEYFVSQRERLHFIAQDFVDRDFTVNSIYVDRHGRVYDPSGMGLQDLKNRIIRTIAPAQESFAKDPVRILRAFRLIAKGFIFSPDVENAIHSWIPQHESPKVGHVYAVTTQMLSSPNATDYLNMLIRFNLITKLLKYFGPISLDQIHYFVSTQAQLSKIRTTSSPTPK